MSGNIENGREYLLHVMECLKKRLAETDAAILELSLIHISEPTRP